MDGEEVDVFFPRPHPIAVAKGYVYTGSLGVNQIASVSVEDEQVQIVPVIGPSHSFVQFAVSPDGATLIGSTDVSGELLVFTLAGRPARPQFVKAVELGKMAFHPIFQPDGKLVWVPVKSRNAIALVDTATWTVTGWIEDVAFKQPHQVVFSADGSTAFVSNNNKAMDASMAGHAMPGSTDTTAPLVIIDTKTHTVIGSIPLGHNLTGMGARPRRQG